MQNTEVRESAAIVKETNIPSGIDSSAVIGLITRVAGPEYANRFIIDPLKADKIGMDNYTIEDSSDGKIHIAATSGVAAAAAFNWYLRNRCQSYIGPITKRICFPAIPPCVGKEYENGSPFIYRYFLNFCTFGYTFAFWTWEQWEPFLDWAAMSGYNLILNPVGNEAVWLDVLMQNGYTRRAAQEFISGPTFFSWQCMMNMTSWGGPAPDSWVEGRIKLARQINDRLRSLGVGVMLPGYSGMVPIDFAEFHPESNPLDQGNWCDFKRPPMLVPGDPCFDSVADSFYRSQSELFGSDFHYFSTDPFHEGGNSGDVDMKAYAVGCYEKMKAVSDNPVWFFQGWQNNPVRDILKALPTENVLVGNLRAEDCADAKDNFADHPWLYCCVNNFGGQRLVHGNMKKLYNEPHQFVSDDRYTMVGIGCMPEGVELDEVMFDILSYISFQRVPLNENDWLRQYIVHRYGRCPDEVYDAWLILQNEVYTSDTSADAKESAFCTRPSLTTDRVCVYNAGRFSYERPALEKACRLLFTAFDEFESGEPFRLDITDFARQALANNAWSYVEGIQSSFINKDIDEFNKNAEVFLSLYYIQDRLTSTNRHMMLGTWLEMAKSHASDINEVAYYEFLARTLITLWGDRAGARELRDYAAKEWNGMLLDFYRPRWDSFIRMLRIAIVTGHEINDYSRYDAEYFFTTLGNTYPTEPQENLCKAILDVFEAL